MQIASALSTLSSAPAIAQDIEEQLKSTLKQSPDLLLLFITAPLTESFTAIVAMLRSSLRPARLLAVSAESVIGAEQEIERAPAVSALAISAPGAVLHAFHLSEDQWEELLTEDDFLAGQIAPETEPVRAFFMFADPFTTPIVQLLEVCSRRFPGAPVIGGMASGMEQPGDARLALDDDVYTSGLVGISFSGDIQIDCVVSQGCRPIGETLVVTKAHQNVIEQLNGKPAMAAMEEMVEHLSTHDRALLQNGGWHIGRVIDPGKGNYGRGDFLIRSLVGVKRDTGAILIGDIAQTGQTIQFHVRDGQSAHEEMRLLLEGESMLASPGPPAGALLVTCNGRGTRLFDAPNHDVGLTRQVLGAMPIAGFFAAGELGPVGDKNFIHGHTAALALFRETPPQ